MKIIDIFNAQSQRLYFEARRGRKYAVPLYPGAEKVLPGILAQAREKFRCEVGIPGLRHFHMRIARGRGDEYGFVALRHKYVADFMKSALRAKGFDVPLFELDAKKTPKDCLKSYSVSVRCQAHGGSHMIP